MTFSPLIIVISKEEVQSGDIEPALSVLKKLTESPGAAKSYVENVDIAFDGYNDYSEELFEIVEVREYVYKLDDEFPYWLYFLSKKHLGLQALYLCFLPPFLNEEGKQKIFPERINSLLSNRWIPALTHICEFVGADENDRDAIAERAVQYIFNGLQRIRGVV